MLRILMVALVRKKAGDGVESGVARSIQSLTYASMRSIASRSSRIPVA